MYDPNMVWKQINRINAKLKRMEGEQVKAKKVEQYETTVGFLIRRGATFDYGPQGDYLLLPSGLDKTT